MTSAQPGDARLLRRVGWQLVAWSGGIVLVVLLALGIVLSITVARSLEATGVAQLQGRAESLSRLIGSDPSPFRPGSGRPQVGFAFGGPGSGTFAFVVPPSGDPIGPPNFDLPAGLPTWPASTRREPPGCRTSGPWTSRARRSGS